MLGGLPIPLDPNVLVGFATSDDAAVYKLTDELAIALTVDIFTPVVDDPYWFGAIAAANALSDIYAMGAKPMAMLSFAGFPRGKLEWDVLTQILRGGAEKAREAGVDVVGGHTVDDPEPKAGYAVFGTVNPSKIVTNAGGQDGDILVLTKPLGIGVLSTALKQGRLSESQIEHVTQVMAKLNRAAAEAMIEVGVHACTDITGYGFLGHLREMTRGSELAAVVQAASVPVLPGVRELVAEGVVPGGTWTNAEFIAPYVSWSGAVDEEMKAILADAQTSGGLLIAVEKNRYEHLMRELEARGVEAHVVGSLVTGAPGTISVEGG